VIPGVICQFFNHDIHFVINVALSFSYIVTDALSLSDCPSFKIFSHPDHVFSCVYSNDLYFKYETFVCFRFWTVDHAGLH